MRDKKDKKYIKLGGGRLRCRPDSRETLRVSRVTGASRSIQEYSRMHGLCRLSGVCGVPRRNRNRGEHRGVPRSAMGNRGVLWSAMEHVEHCRASRVHGAPWETRSAAECHRVLQRVRSMGEQAEYVEYRRVPRSTRSARE